MTARLLREPLVHFLGIGLLLFLLYGFVAPPEGGGATIRITAATIAGIAAEHERVWGRPPTAAELDSLLDARITEEILYREGLSLGLDRDDAVIKRRVRQKYELIAEEEDGRPATEADLVAFLAAHPERFRRPPVLSFVQVLVPSGGDDADLAARAARLRATLEAGADPASAGQPTLLPLETKGQPLDTVSRDFGDEFAGSLANLPVGSWQGPVRSAYGQHLVKIEARTAAAMPTLGEVRDEVSREWENARRVEARAARLEALRRRYQVVVEDRE